MSNISSETIGGKGTRRKIVCCNCGRYQKPSRRQRASRFKPLCFHCGHSRFEVKSDLLEREICVVQMTKYNSHETDTGRHIL